MTKLTEISRGVADPEATAAFYAWLLDTSPHDDAAGFRFNYSGGSLLIHGDTAVPVAVTLSEADAPFRGPDPDGVPVVAVSAAAPSESKSSVRLDHVRLNCGDLATAAGFYRDLGFSLTWSGSEDPEAHGPRDSAVDGATWMHLTCDAGYLSISQADWKEYGQHTMSSGPPRFVHIGLAVDDLAPILERLDRADTPYVHGTNGVGHSTYVSDPDGVPALGSNVEIVEYLPAIQRSGTRLAASSSGR